jgi:DNA topoisomerase-3
VKPNKRIFNNAKVSDHFAIIPTSLTPKHLAEEEQKIYDMVTRRFLAVFYPPRIPGDRPNHARAG